MPALQIRDIPDNVHRALKVRAAASGRSLSEYALAVLARETTRPTLDELLDRVRVRGPVDLGDSTVEILREDRDERR